MFQKRQLFLFLIGFTLIVLVLFNRFLDYASTRTCLVVTDWLHPYFTALDWSVLILPLTYLPVLLFVWLHRNNLNQLNLFLLGFSGLVLSRMLTIYWLPLCEPSGAIPLQDELLNGIFYPGGYCAVDLFYSGHTATLFLLVLLSPLFWKWLFAFITLLVATLLVIQKVHYTIDVVMAVPFTWIIASLSKRAYGFLVKEM